MLLHKIASGIRRRSRTAAAKIYLSVRHKVAGQPVWFDNGRIKLPFHGDDNQEIFYKLDGREWWDKELKLISPYLKQGDVAIDVGANLGFMSGILSTLTGASGQVYSFEPSPVAFPKLVEIMKANNFSTVSAYNMGCGKEEQSMTLFCPPNSGHASLRPTTAVAQSALEKKIVPIVKLDDFLGPKLERLNFLKIDTEGYEDDVLYGATDILRRFHPVIYIELCSEYRSSSERAVRHLLDLGYAFDREVDLNHSSNGDNFFALPPGFRPVTPGI
jgi:FkbM family methyltransferase